MSQADTRLASARTTNEAALPRPAAVVRYRIGLAVDDVDNGFGPVQTVRQKHHRSETVELGGRLADLRSVRVVHAVGGAQRLKDGGNGTAVAVGEEQDGL